MAVVDLNVSFSIFAKLNLGLRINLFVLKHFCVCIRVNLDSLENISYAFVLTCDQLNLCRVKIIHIHFV